MKIIPLDALIPYDRNARTHSPAQVDEIVRSMEEFGWTNPILADDAGNIVAGHGRRLAALALYERGGRITFPGKGGPELPVGTVPVIDCSGWSDAQRRAYVLADNQIALRADWDFSILAEEIRGLDADGFDLGLMAFDEETLRNALGELPAIPDDEDAAGDDEGGDGEQESETAARVTLAERFGIVPFSVLNAREGWWQNRKRAWVGLGIKSELGRGAAAYNDGAELGGGGLADQVAAAASARRRFAVPGGAPMPLDRAKGAR